MPFIERAQKEPNPPSLHVGHLSYQVQKGHLRDPGLTAVHSSHNARPLAPLLSLCRDQRYEKGPHTCASI